MILHRHLIVPKLGPETKTPMSAHPLPCSMNLSIRLVKLDVISRQQMQVMPLLWLVLSCHHLPDDLGCPKLADPSIFLCRNSNMVAMIHLTARSETFRLSKWHSTAPIVRQLKAEESMHHHTLSRTPTKRSGNRQQRSTMFPTPSSSFVLLLARCRSASILFHACKE